MKLAVWRLGASYQTELDSSVGGGRIAARAVLDLVELGHCVTVCGSTSAQTAAWLTAVGADHQPYLRDLRGFDGALVLTGPFNALYGALAHTYERLSSLEGVAAYAQWDTALPMHFAPQRVPLLAERCSATTEDLTRNKRWHLLTQTARSMRRSGGSIGGDLYCPAATRCFWELAELDAEAKLSPTVEAVPCFAYFGSDRPGRLGELRRWFGGPSAPPLHLYGKWRPESLNRVLSTRVRYCGPVQEREVRVRLNQYAATLHSADPEYVRSDFVAQRFIENAMACVPTVYSDRIQPSVASVVPAEWVVTGPAALAEWWRSVRDHGARIAAALRHQEVVLSWASQNPHRPKQVLQEVFQ